MNKVQFSSQGKKIDGSLITPGVKSGTLPAVIFFHGCTGSQNGHLQYAQALAEQGVVCLAVSLGGHGESEGNFETTTFSDNLNDVFATYDFLKDQWGVDQNAIGVSASSFSCGMASLLAVQRPVKSMLFKVPAAYSEDMMHMPYGKIMPIEQKIFHDLTDIDNIPSVKAIEQFEGSLLVVVSENDTIIPRAIPNAYFSHASRAVNKEFFILPNAPHEITDEKIRSLFSDKLVHWFTSTLK